MTSSSSFLDPQTAVDQLLGEGRAQVVESVSSSKVAESEVVLVNGTPVRLIGADGAALRVALESGQVPDRGLLNRVLATALGSDVARRITLVESEVTVNERVSTRAATSIVRGDRAVEECTREWTADWGATGRRKDQVDGRLRLGSQGDPIFSPLASASTSFKEDKGQTRCSPEGLPEAFAHSTSVRESSGISEAKCDRPTTVVQREKSTNEGLPIRPRHKETLVYEEGVLVAGSLESLLSLATPTASYHPDTAYLFAFLLSGRLFFQPHHLLRTLAGCSGSNSQTENSGNNLSDRNGPLGTHLVRLLREWTEAFPYDFRDEEMMACVRDLTHRCLSFRSSLRPQVTQVLHALLNKLTELERHEEQLSRLASGATIDPKLPSSDICDWSYSHRDVAEQLTCIEMERLSFVGPEEFVQSFAKDNMSESGVPAKKTSNLESYIEWFNRLSSLVATQACSPLKRKRRVQVIESWIEVARECFNIGNFNSLMGIVAGLNLPPVSRLKKTWSKIDRARFSILDHQMDPSSNFSSYRSSLRAAVSRSEASTEAAQKVVVPFFSLLVKDFFFLNEGCANRLPNGFINFGKFWQLANNVSEFLSWRQVECPFRRDDGLCRLLQATLVSSESELSLVSYERETPDTPYEKERLKTLRRQQLTSKA